MSELDALFNEFDQQEQLGRTTATEPTEAAKSTTAQPPEKYAKSVLFVRGVPKDATNEELEGFFSNVGPVRSCFVVCDKKPEGSEDAPAAAENNKTVKNRGFGFVQFVLAEDAARAIEQLAETKFRDQKRLMLDFAMRKGTRDPADKVPAKRPRQNAKQQDAKQQDTKQQDAKQGATQQDAEQQDAKQQDRPDHAAKKQKLNSGTKVESRTITIGSLPAGVTKKHLVKRVKKVGNPHSIVYPAPFKGATDEQLKDGAGGSAHITFGDHAGAMAAIKALNNHVFKGAKLSVKLRTEYVNKNARLIVRNLPFKVRERDLENMLSGCGTVLEVDLPRKFTGGPLRGFAFVQMGDYGSAKRAVEKWDQSTLQGRTLSVGMAIAKDRFKEMEEKGEVEKPDFADSDEEMEAADSNDESASTAESDGEDCENNMDVDDDGEEPGTAASDLDDKDQSDVVDESLQEGCTVFIRNLSFDSDEDDLFEHFRKFGRLRYCRIVYDQQTGRSRGTAF
ncbi:RNA recognition motif-containing protein, partial [Coemansia sp. RSA 2702]